VDRVAFGHGLKGTVAPVKPDELVRAFYERFSVEAMLAGELDDFIDPDLEVELPHYPDTDAGRGLEGFKDFIREIASAWDGWGWKFESLAVEGDTVLAFVRLQATGKGSGARTDTPAAHVWTVSEGKARRVKVYPDRDQAAEAAGLRP